MKILLLSRWCPFPPDNGSRIRVLNIMRVLARRHDVSLVIGEHGLDQLSPRSAEALQELCSNVRVAPCPTFKPMSARGVVGLVSPQPRFLVATHSEAMSSAVSEEFQRLKPDLVLASQLSMMPYALSLRGVPALLEELELSVFKDAPVQRSGMPRKVRSLLTWMKLRGYLQRSLDRFAACTVVSELERENLREVAPGYRNVTVVPNALDLSSYTGHFGTPQPNTIVFAGPLTYAANYDAVRFFLERVYPYIVQSVPDVSFRIIGANANVNLEALRGHPGVSLVGYVEDVRPIVARSWLSVAPLRVGGGTRLKILESMALGTPVVATSKGAEGLNIADHRDILIGDHPRLMASKVVELIRSPALRRRLSDSGRRLVESTYDWAIVGETLSSLVEETAAAKAA